MRCSLAVCVGRQKEACLQAQHGVKQADMAKLCHGLGVIVAQLRAGLLQYALLRLHHHSRLVCIMALVPCMPSYFAACKAC